MTQWLKEPSEFISIVISLVALLFSAIALIQYSKTNKLAKEAREISIAPVLRLYFQISNEGAMVTLKNISNIVVTEIKLTSINYEIKNNPCEITKRQSSPGMIVAAQMFGLFPSRSRLKGGESFNLLPGLLVYGNVDEGGLCSAVITYRRELDLKKFAVIVVFRAYDLDPARTHPRFEILLGEQTSFLEFNSSDALNQLRLIQETEKMIFKIDAFQ